MSSRMQRKKEEKRKVILEVAEKIITEKGIWGITMDQVAEEADVAKGTLYRYFKNKNSLLAAVSAKLNKEVNKSISEKMNLCRTGSEKIMACGMAIVEFVFENPKRASAFRELYQMEIKDKEDPNVQELLREVNRTLEIKEESFKQAIKEGSVRKDLDPVPTAMLLRMFFINALTPTSEQMMLLESNKISMERYLTIVQNLVIRATHSRQPDVVGEKKHSDVTDDS